MLNLTCLSENPDSVSADELKAIKKAAMPGDGFELHIGPSGSIKWQHFDGHGSVPVEIQFRPYSNTLIITTPDCIKVEVRKVTRC